MSVNNLIQQFVRSLPYLAMRRAGAVVLRQRARQSALRHKLSRKSFHLGPKSQILRVPLAASTVERTRPVVEAVVQRIAYGVAMLAGLGMKSLSEVRDLHAIEGHGIMSGVMARIAELVPALRSETTRALKKGRLK